VSKQEDWPTVGMKITCPDFAFGKVQASGMVHVNSARICSQPRSNTVPANPEQVKLAEGLFRQKVDKLSFREDYNEGRHNPEWATATFYVLQARWAGGGRGHNDTYPDGWFIVAVRLDAAGTPTNDFIQFYIKGTGCFNEESTIDPARIREVP
jgi:hypothetical protein